MPFESGYVLDYFVGKQRHALKMLQKKSLSCMRSGNYMLSSVAFTVTVSLVECCNKF